jgi:vacuolar-type H+-ATPase subunit I/STV1
VEVLDFTLDNTDNKSMTTNTSISDLAEMRSDVDRAATRLTAARAELEAARADYMEAQRVYLKAEDAAYDLWRELR